MEALLVVDLQVDFCPGGALPAPNANKIVPLINNLMGKFETVIASRDVHPEQTVHFKKWPVHCVKDTPGAQYHNDFDVSKVNIELCKGTNDKDDGYSAFESSNENLVEYLHNHKITDIYIVGLTTEYCVLNTAMDSIENGFNTYILEDAIAAVEPDSQSEKQAKDKMIKAGIKLIKSEDFQ